ncbi:EF-P 5-aminopentanol modification-associated protein YfmH [Helicovermis profundi]|uniref:Pitrilysin family protein n=1 Tax=Helicovermis profundi TaxID=3065157 RepID=A0AAU9EDP2_9FIRM|nr:pitrilysin family protein [Clostridia bacterium S502]
MMKIEKTYNELLGEEVYKKIHPSGLEIYFIPKKNYQKKYAYFATRYGALYNDFIPFGEDEVKSMPLGIAHFLEHKIFEAKDKNIFEEFAKLGASVNAFTNYQSTAYMFSTVNNFYECFDILMDFVQTPHLTDENVEKEKGIITQEIKMYDDDPNWAVYFNLLKAMYKNHPMKHDIAGSVDSVMKTTRGELQECYDYFYSPKNMMIFVIGDLDMDDIVDATDKSLKESFLSKGAVPKILIKDEPLKVNKKRIEKDFKLPIPVFYMGFKDNVQEVNTRERLKKNIALKIALDLMFGKGSEFFKTHYDRGTINNSFSYEYSFGRTFSYSVIGGETKEADFLNEEILKEINKFKQNGFNEKDFERIKKKLTGRYLSSFNSIKYIANTFISYFMKDINLFDYLDVLNELDVNGVKKIMNNHFDTENFSVSMVK